MENNLEQIHDCEKSHGKMVVIARDLLDNTYCGYCHQRVDYKRILSHQKSSWSGY